VNKSDDAGHEAGSVVVTHVFPWSAFWAILWGLAPYEFVENWEIAGKGIEVSATVEGRVFGAEVMAVDGSRAMPQAADRVYAATRNNSDDVAYRALPHCRRSIEYALAIRASRDAALNQRRFWARMGWILVWTMVLLFPLGCIGMCATAIWMMSTEPSVITVILGVMFLCVACVLALIAGLEYGRRRRYPQLSGPLLGLLQGQWYITAPKLCVADLGDTLQSIPEAYPIRKAFRVNTPSVAAVCTDTPNATYQIGGPHFDCHGVVAGTCVVCGLKGFSTRAARITPVATKRLQDLPWLWEGVDAGVNVGEYQALETWLAASSYNAAQREAMRRAFSSVRAVGGEISVRIKGFNKGDETRNYVTTPDHFSRCPDKAFKGRIITGFDSTFTSSIAPAVVAATPTISALLRGAGLAWACGMDTDAVSEWVTNVGTNMDPTGTFAALIMGDDSLVYAGGLWWMVDCKAFESSVRVHHEIAALATMVRAGMPYSVADLLWRQSTNVAGTISCASRKGVDGRIRFSLDNFPVDVKLSRYLNTDGSYTANRVSIDAEGIRASGSPMTSIGNTIINAFLLREAFGKGVLEVDAIKRVFADYGFEAKVKSVEHVEQADFCSGTFMHAGDGVLFVPKLGRYICKFGVNHGGFKTGPVLYDTYRSMWASWAMGMSVFGVGPGSVTAAMRPWCEGVVPKFHPYKVRHSGTSLRPTPREVDEFFLKRYGCSSAILLEIAARFESVALEPRAKYRWPIPATVAFHAQDLPDIVAIMAMDLA